MTKQPDKTENLQRLSTRAVELPAESDMHRGAGVVVRGAFADAEQSQLLVDLPEGGGPSYPARRAAGPSSPVPPAPELGSDELAADMAELYAAVLSRGFPLARLKGDEPKAEGLAGMLAELSWFRPDGRPEAVAAQRRWASRAGRMDGRMLFRGTAPGCGDGPYLSQFMLRGAGTPGDVAQGLISVGANQIEQRIREKGGGRFVGQLSDLALRARTSPLQQPFLNAALILLAEGATGDYGLESCPDSNLSKGSVPSVMTAITAMVGRATVAASAAEPRMPPDALALVAALSASGEGARLGDAEAAAEQHVRKLVRAGREGRGGTLLHRMKARKLPQGGGGQPGITVATVVGACVTVMKGLFELFDGPDSWEPLRLDRVGHGRMREVLVTDPRSGGLRLTDIAGTEPQPLTLEGELNKVAANIAYGRMADGAMLYSDLHDGLRLGETLALDFLTEQLAECPDAAQVRLLGFDGRRIVVRTPEGPEKG